MNKITIDHSSLKARPEEEDFHQKYTKDASGIIGGKLIDGYFKAVEALVKKTGLKKGKALEIGCGAGYSTLQLRNMLPSRIDLEASEYVERLLFDAKRLNPGMRITLESVYEMKRKEQSFELIFLLEVLEHLDYPDAALLEIFRVLKDNGHLVVGVPREPLWSVLNMARFKYVSNIGNTPGHLHRWSKGKLIKLLAKNRFATVGIRLPLPWTLLLARKAASALLSNADDGEKK